MSSFTYRLKTSPPLATPAHMLQLIGRTFGTFGSEDMVFTRENGKMWLRKRGDEKFF
jgi:hypothetical protein